MLGILLLSVVPMALLSFALGGGDDDTDAGTTPSDDDTPSDNSDDVVRGGEGANALSGDGGDDLLMGFLGDDTLRGGSGDDLLDGSGGDDSLMGGNGEDVLIGGAGEDTLAGMGGNDLLLGNGGNDVLAGDDGNDLLIDFSGADTIDGGLGNDTLIGIDLSDKVDATDLVALRRADLDAALTETFGNEVNDDQIDRIFAEVLSGEPTGDADVLRGNIGNDILVGDNGDTLTGGSGNDTFAAYFDPTAPAERVIITDFVPADDSLQVIVEGDGTGTLTFEAGEGGLGSFIRYDGSIVAFVRDATPAQLAEATVVTRAASAFV